MSPVSETQCSTNFLLYVKHLALHKDHENLSTIIQLDYKVRECSVNKMYEASNIPIITIFATHIFKSIAIAIHNLEGFNLVMLQHNGSC